MGFWGRGDQFGFCLKEKFNVLCTSQQSNSFMVWVTLNINSGQGGSLHSLSLERNFYAFVLSKSVILCVLESREDTKLATSPL